MWSTLANTMLFGVLNIAAKCLTSRNFKVFFGYYMHINFMYAELQEHCDFL